MSAPDPFVTFDAAYVLGALSPQDSAAFEAHLGQCERCARSVRELAGLPGFLAQAEETPAAPAAGTAPPPPPPATLLPALLDRVRGARRRRRRQLVSTAALALAACAALLLVLLLPDARPGGEGRTGDGGTGPIAMTSLVGYPVEATVSLDEDAGLTRVEMDCRYGTADSEGAEAVEYVLVAITREGEAHELATWRTLPDHPVSLSVATDLPRPAIASLEVRSTSGYPVLRTHLPGSP